MKRANEKTDKPSANKTEALREGSKLFQDTFKHITTLSTGSIVFLATFVDKFKGLPNISLAICALVGFIVSIIGSVLLMLFLAKDVSTEGRKHWYDILFHVGSWVTVAVFITGILLLVIFAIKNLSVVLQPATHPSQ